MEQLKPLSTKLKVSIMGGLPLIGGGKSDLSNSLLGRILFFLFCCLFSNNLFAQSDWRLVQDFESLTSSDVKACTTDGNITTNATVSIDTEATHGNIGKLNKPSSGQATYGIVFAVSLGTNKLSDYSQLKIETYATSGYKVLGIYIRQTSTSGQFQQIASVNNGFGGNNTWTTQTFNITTTGYDYSDVDFFIAAVNAYESMTIQIDNIELYGPAIGSSTVDISETVDNSITSQSGVTVNLTRSLVAGMWNTICLPFVPTPEQANTIFGTGAKFAEFSSVSNDVMQFTSVDVASLQAGTPYLVLPTQSQSAEEPIVLNNINITATSAETVTYDGYSFVGTYTKTSFTTENWPATRFVASGNELKTPNSTNALKSLRAYFTVPVPGGTSSAKNYTFAVDSFVPTSIDNIQIEDDGDGAIYNIDGQRVEGKSLAKGIYIRNGKKFVVK